MAYEDAAVSAVINYRKLLAISAINHGFQGFSRFLCFCFYGQPFMARLFRETQIKGSTISQLLGNRFQFKIWRMLSFNER